MTTSGTNPIAAVSNSAVIQLRTVDDLRLQEPTVAGEIATVLEYGINTRMGGGVFVYDPTDSSTPDDGGMHFVTPGKKRWKRVVLDYSSVTVVDFGAVADGETDCIDAVIRMFRWSQRVLPSAGIRFPAGEFSLSGFDQAQVLGSDREINRFKISGAPVNFGYFPTTTLKFNWGPKPRKSHFFNVKSRYVEISGFVVKGMSSDSGEDGGTAFNNVGFFTNSIIGGQFLRVSSMEFRYLGGRALELIDTLDCKIDQFYSRGCQGSIVYARWSDRERGAWDHSTAIELSNFNLQRSTKQPVLDLPRCTQSFIRNGWIEHSEFAGDLTNGQWTIEGLVIESTQNPMKMGYCRAMIIQKSVHRDSAGLDFSKEGIEPWTLLAEGDRGVMEISDLGAIMQGSLSYDFMTSQHHMDNRGKETRWFYVGEFNFSDAASQIHLRILGTAQYVSQSATQTDYSFRTPEGVAHIYLQARENAETIGSWYSEGSSPVIKVHIEGTGARTKLYVKIPGYTGYSIALVETNGRDRYQSGQCFIFRKSFTVCSSEEGAALDSKPVVAFEQRWVGNKDVGFGYNDDKELLLRGPAFFKDVEYEPGKWKRRHFLKVRVNGTPRSIELLDPDNPTE